MSNKPEQRPRFHTIKLPMTKEQFAIEYVLLRAGHVEAGFSGEAAAREACDAWELIQRRKGAA
jgi:hypothetical protein